MSRRNFEAAAVIFCFFFCTLLFVLLAHGERSGGEVDIYWDELGTQKLIAVCDKLDPDTATASGCKLARGASLDELIKLQMLNHLAQIKQLQIDVRDCQRQYERSKYGADEQKVGQ